MNYKPNLFGAMLCLIVFHAIAPAALPQEQPDKAKPGDASKSEDKKKKATADSAITYVFRISAEGLSKIPPDSKIAVKGGDEEICKKLNQSQPLEPSGVASFSLPVCKVKLEIYISGFDSKSVSVDLGKYKDPIRIEVKLKGEPVVSP